MGNAQSENGDVNLEHLMSMVSQHRASLAHDLPRARIVELDSGDEKTDEKTEKQTVKDPDSDTDKEDTDSDEDAVEKGEALSRVETADVLDTVRSVARILRAAEASTDIKLSSMVRLRDTVLKMKDKQLDNVTKDAAMSELLEVWTVTAKRTVLARNSQSSASPTVRENWKMMELIYELLVKISDRSDSLSRKLAKTDLLRHTINILGNQQHKAQSTNEPYASATSWMIELLGNCYDGFEETVLRDKCRQLVDFYSQSECETIQIKAGQTKMMITFKDQQKPSRSESASGGTTIVGDEETEATPQKEKKNETKNERSSSSPFTTGRGNQANPTDLSTTLNKMLTDMQETLQRGVGLTELQSMMRVSNSLLTDLQESLLQHVGELENASDSDRQELRKALALLQKSLSQMSQLESLVSSQTGGEDADVAPNIEALQSLVADLQQNLSQQSGENSGDDAGDGETSAETLHDMLRELQSNLQEHFGGADASSGHAHVLHSLLQGLGGQLGGLGGGLGDLGSLSSLLGNATEGAGNSKEEKEAAEKCRIGMPKVFTEKIKGWYRNPERWIAFNRDGEMWTTVKESFKEMVEGAKHSTDFGKALCEAGIIEVVQDILSNSQIQGAYIRNGKTQEVVVGCLLILFYTAKLQTADKFIRVAKVWDVLQGYLISDDVNIRGHAILIVSYISRLEGPVDCFSMKFNACDIQMLVATHMSYKQDAGAMGDFLAKTNFPELCVRELRNFVTRDSGNEDIKDDEWGEVLLMTRLLVAASHESDMFAKHLAEANVIEPIQITLSSTYFQAREEEMKCGFLMKNMVLMAHNCVRLPEESIKKLSLVPNLWPHIYRLTTIRRTEELKNLGAFLAFIHMHGVVPDRGSRQVTIDQFPKLNRTFDDIKYVNSLWQNTKGYERKVLGDYMAATGGATVHVELLGDLVENLNALASGEPRKNYKILLGNVNNFALNSAAFALEVCRSGLLEHLKNILTSNGCDQDLNRIKDDEKELLDYCVSCAHACAEYAVNMQFFRSADISATMCRYMMADVGLGEDIKRRATTAVVYLLHYDPEQVRPHIAQHRVTSLTEKELQFYHNLEQTCAVENVEEKAGNLLVELGVAETMGRKLQDLVQNGLLLTTFDLTRQLINCLLNYTLCSQQFSVALQNVEVLASCQQIIRDPEYRDTEKDERKPPILCAALGIILNSAQYECTHTTLHNLRVHNELFQFTHGKDMKVNAIATLAMALLVREENAHILRLSCKSGVIRFLLEKLDEGTSAKNDVKIPDDFWSSTALLNGFLNMSLNDGNKVTLVYDGILPTLTRILHKGNPEDKQLAANLAWSLTFHEENKYYIEQEQSLVDALGSLSNEEAGEATVSAKGALCQLKMTRENINKEIERRAQQNLDNTEYETLSHDVYLSYHPKSERMFSQLKDTLEKEGFTVASVNHQSLTDDIFRQMTSAIEGARVVVVEVSRQYQRSFFCRTEAEYGYNLLTPLIPVRTDQGLKPLAWFARMFMGRQIFDFSRNVTRNELEAREIQILKEIKHALRRGQDKE